MAAGCRVCVTGPVRTISAINAREHWAVRAKLQAQVTASLKRWEPRIDVVSVGVKFDNENTTAHIMVTYRLKDTYDIRNLLVPFYLIPNEDERLPQLPQANQESP